MELVLAVLRGMTLLVLPMMLVVGLLGQHLWFSEPIFGSLNQTPFPCAIQL